MRELTTREKIGIVAVIIAAIVALYSFGILDPSKLGLTGGDLSAKETELKNTENLVKFKKLASDIEDDIMAEVGLQDNLIPQPLFEQINEKLTVEKLNKAKTPKDLYEIDSALKNKASQILAYRKENGKFENLEQLKEIKCSIFEGDPPQAVLSKRISELTKKVGLQPKYQLSVKPLPGKKQERLTIQNRQKLVEKLYRHELEEELQSLTKEEQVRQEPGKPENEKTGPEVSATSANDETGRSETGTNDLQEDAEESQEEKKIDQKFPLLPEGIPVKTRIEIGKAILSSADPIRKQVGSNAQLKKLIDEFEMSEQEKTLNIEPFISNYVDQVDKTQEELIKWLKSAPTSYSKQAYYVEMTSVKGKLEQLVRLIHSIESSAPFLKIRDFQLTIANKRETVLNANIKLVATVL